ncbi:MAG: EAL domain-containing protein [Pseudomonadota bacterium]
MKVDPITLDRMQSECAGTSSDWFWETDRDHRYCYLSIKLGRSVNIDSQLLMGRSRLEIALGDPSSPKWAAHLSDLRKHRPFNNFEYHVVQADGRIAWVSASGEPFFDRTGRFLGYRGTGHDITNEKLAIAQLEAANAALLTRNKQLDDAHKALERSVYEDTLTDAHNRRAFERDLQAVLAEANQQVGLLHIDLDRFKWVNDTLGHPAGDIVLQTAANRIGTAALELGTTYRVGGDEFMVILRDAASLDVATSLGHRITEAMSAPIRLDRGTVRVGACVGVAVENSKDVNDRGLISQADAALYEAKARGHNTVCAATQNLRRRIQEHRWIAADLPRAIERDELVPYFQPQIDLVTGDIIGVETLVRWQHPHRGIIHPQNFLGVATELALCNEIDRIMLKKGLATVDRLAASGLPLPSLSVNTSQARLVDPRLISDIGCYWTNLDCNLSLELLETISFDQCCDRIQLEHNLERLRSMGVRIETDDFGSARASITGLLKIRPHRLKIDQSLVKGVITDPDKRSTVRAILELAQNLQIECLAEGAEDNVTLDVLADLGCTQVQGHAVAPALPETELIAFLRSRTIAGVRREKPSLIVGPKQKTAPPLGMPYPA